MKKRISIFLTLALLSLLSITMFLIVGCSLSKGKFEIIAKNPLPIIEPYKEFDMTSALETQEGVSYSFEGYYINDKGTQRDIVFDGSVFTITVGNAEFANITVTGTKGSETAEKEISLTIKGTPDVVDNGFNELWDEDIITKSLNYNPQYVKDGNSSVKVSFQGYYNEWGTQFASLNGHLCTIEGGIYDTEHFSIYKEADQDKAWEDAIMTFWIYYATPPKDHADTVLDIGYHFCLHSTEVLPEGALKDFDWKSISFCNANEWTQIAIRFKDLNKLTPLFLDFERYKIGWRTNEELLDICDVLNLKCRVKDADFESMDVKYAYAFYFDAVDILTFADFSEKYPDFDFVSNAVEISDNDQWFNFKRGLPDFASSDKALTFDYKAIDKDTNDGDVFAFTLWGTDWAPVRRTEIINIDVVNNTSSVGEVEALKDDWYRVTIPAKDLPLNISDDPPASGTETLGSIIFNEVHHAFLIDNVEFVEIK